MIGRYRECLAELECMDLEGAASLLAGARYIYVAGNGGSAATASHLASDLARIGRPCSCLSDNISQLTMYANDVSYPAAFASQIIRAGKGDVLVVLSVSGNSPNLLEAVGMAHLRGVASLALLGSGGGLLVQHAQHSLISSSARYGEVESIHSCICHMLPTLIQELVMSNSAVFLDRDGVINREVNYCSTPRDFELLPGVAQAIRLLNLHQMKVIVVTNQSGVGRGMFTLQDLEAIHAKMRDELRQKGATIDGVYFCPHRPDENCQCRKPHAALFLQGAQEHNIDIGRSYVIGDRETDIEVCASLPLKGMRIAEGGLLEAVRIILGG